jgi:hypothetical protein
MPQPKPIDVEEKIFGLELELEEGLMYSLLLDTRY